MPTTLEKTAAWVSAHRRFKALETQYFAEKATAARTYDALLKAKAELETAAQDLAADPT